MFIRKLVLFVIIIITLHQSHAQGIGIGTTTPHASAQLDITSTSKGLLIPRMTSALRTSIVSPAKGLLVYDSTTNSFWVHNGSAWSNLATSATSWSITGNSGTNSNTNFIGTNDNVSLRFKIGGGEVGYLATNGNIFWGLSSGFNNTSGLGNIGIGMNTLFANTDGYNNTAIGQNALAQNNLGMENTAVGVSALGANTTGYTNTAFGLYSLYSNTTGNNNTALGGAALGSNTTGYSNVALGAFTLYNNLTSSNLIAIGDSALYKNTGGILNTAVGSKALYNNTSGPHNTAIGFAALYSNINGDYNTATGANSLYSNATGRYNSAFGDGALYTNSAGTFNTAIGFNALYSNVSHENTGGGYKSLYSNTGGNNTAWGARTMELNVGGSQNTAIGFYALQNSTGNSNTAIGGGSLINLNTGNENSALGYSTAVISGLSNATAIGARSRVDCSNCMVLGSISGINSALASVNVGIGTTLPQQMLSVGSSINVDQSNANNGTINPGLSFGSASGEGIASKRTGGGNQFGLDFYTNSINRMSITLSGNVGIGITNPQSTLHLGNSGVLKINDGSGSRYVQIFHSNTGNLHIDAFGGGTNYISWYGGSGLHVGNGSAGGYGPVNASAFIISSSLQYKKNIINAHYGLQQVLQLQAKKYQYINDNTDRNEIGLIAEEVEKIIPEVVYRNLPGGKISGIDYGKLVPVLIEAVKEQQQQITELKKLVDQLLKQPRQ